MGGQEKHAARDVEGVETRGSRKLRVCVLQCAQPESKQQGTTGTLSQPSVYDGEGKYEWGSVLLLKSSAVKQVQQLVRSGEWDVFLNLCDGMWGEDGRAGVEVVQALHKLGAAFTGPDPNCFEPSKAEQKGAAFYFSQPTAPWALIEQDGAATEAQVADAVEGLTFPLTVRANSWERDGLRDVPTFKSHSLQDLTQRLRPFLLAHGPAVVEEAVEGRRLSVVVVEGLDGKPQALRPVEALGGSSDGTPTYQPLDTAAEASLDRALRSAACDVFSGLRGRSYGRADFWLPKDGTGPLVAGMSTMCELFGPKGSARGAADHVLLWDEELGGHAGFLDRVLTRAVQVHAEARHKKSTQVRYKHSVGFFGLFANRTIKAGEVINRHEERSHVITTCSHIAASFGPAALPGPSPADLPYSDPKLAALAAAWGSSAAKLHQATNGKAAGRGQLQQHGGSNSALGLDSHHLELSPGEVSPSSSRPSLSPSGSLDSLVDGSASNSNSASASTCSCARATLQAEEGSGAAAVTAGQQQQAEHELDVRGQWFKAYAYPLTDETWVTWSEDPADWLPLNHCCEPNAWLTGLNLVARRDIAPGEQVTADYATFTVHNMAEFDCRCGSAACRGRITGADYLAPWVEQRYGSHVSGYVATKRAQLKARLGVVA